MPQYSKKPLTPQELLEILSLSPNATGIYSGADVIIEAANDAMLTFWGKERSIIGLPMAEAIPELKGQPFIGILQQVILTGKDYEAKNAEAKLVFNGKLQTFYFDFIYKAVHFGDAIYVLHTATDVTDHFLSAQESAKLRNNLTVVEEKLIVANQQINIVNEAWQKAQKESEFQQTTLYNFFMQAPAGICILSGEKLVFELVNPYYQQLIPERELLGKPIFSAVPELIGQPVEEILHFVYKTGETRQVKELLIKVAKKQGGQTEDRFFNFTYLGRRNFKGVVDGILVFVYEVTEQVTARKKLEESEQHFRHLADLVPAKISNALPTGEVTFFNRQWLDFSGLSFEDTRDFGYHQMMHPDEIEKFQIGLRHAATNGIPYQSEMRFKNTEGEYIWHLNIASPVLDDDGVIQMWVGSTTDIHKLKEEEQRKSNFVSMLSHELKTPVTSIKGYTQILQQIIESEKDIEYPQIFKKSLQRMNNLVLQLTAMISEMLDLKRIESGRLEIKKTNVSLNQIIETVVEDFRLTNDKHIINLQQDVECMINADADKIGQVLNNFISNAIKYAPESKIIDVKIFHINNVVAVSVKDYGIGIDKAEHEKVFDRFYRVQGKLEKNFSGFGIGLFIAKTIIENHDGYIIIESGKGQGSTFTFNIPFIAVKAY